MLIRRADMRSRVAIRIPLVGIMLARRGSLIWLSALLLPPQFALADNAKHGSTSSAHAISNRNAGQASTSSPHTAAKHNKIRHAPFNYSLPRLEQDPGMNAAQLRPSLARPGMRLDEPQKDAATGLHWSTADSRPGPAYRLDKDEDVRLHFGRRGASVNLGMSF